MAYLLMEPKTIINVIVILLILYIILSQMIGDNVQLDVLFIRRDQQLDHEVFFGCCFICYAPKATGRASTRRGVPGSIPLGTGDAPRAG